MATSAPTKSPVTNAVSSSGYDSFSRENIAAPQPTAEDIQGLAYRYWEERQRNGLPGSDIGDWLRAETDIHRSREQALEEGADPVDSLTHQS